jgi:hypothetical protein
MNVISFSGKKKRSFLKETKNICITCGDISFSLILLHKTRRQNHCMCYECLKNYLIFNLEKRLEILFNTHNTRNFNLLYLDCPGFINKKCCKKIYCENIIPLDEYICSLFQKINLFINIPESIFCRNKQCKNLIIQDDLLSQEDLLFGGEIKCPVCEDNFCKICKAIPYHSNKSCLEFELEEQKTENSKYIISLMKNETMKCCPECKFPVLKNEGCNKMICEFCKTKWCWLCNIKNIDYDHYNENNKDSYCKGRLWEGTTII